MDCQGVSGTMCDVSPSREIQSWNKIEQERYVRDVLQFGFWKTDAYTYKYLSLSDISALLSSWRRLFRRSSRLLITKASSNFSGSSWILTASLTADTALCKMTYSLLELSLRAATSAYSLAALVWPSATRLLSAFIWKNYSGSYIVDFV